MKPVTADWVAKAEEDYALAVLARKSKQRLHSGACFHCQQCSEKYLKARLVEAGFVMTKTHNLPALLDLVLPVEPLWEPFRESLALLTRYAVEVRYPGDDTTGDDARMAMSCCRAFRRRARASLGLVERKQRRKATKRSQRAQGQKR